MKLWEKLKFLLEIRKNLISNGVDFILKFLKRNESKAKLFIYIWLLILNVIFVYLLIKEGNLLKIVIYLIWITLTLFILDTFKELSLGISETNEQRFLIYGIVFFWLNVSCAFFFIWSNVARPCVRYLIVSWKLYEIIPWKIDLNLALKIVNYGFALEYWEFIFVLAIFYMKIFMDAYHYDEETKTVDYYIEYKGTWIYEYKDVIDVFNVWRVVVIALASLFRILFISNPLYINDIFLLLVFLVIFISVYLFLWKEYLKYNKKNEKVSR
jgi:hypothetical protein